MNPWKKCSSFNIAASIILTTAATLLSGSCLSCGPVSDLRDFSNTDLFPPVILNILPVDESTIRLDFNEVVIINPSPRLTPELGDILISPDGNSLLLGFSKKQQAGVQYVINAEVADETGNTMSFLVPFYGFNPNLPKLLINEFTCQGSTTHPDVVELLVTEAGDLAGLWIVEGTTDYPEESICLPPCPVEAGEMFLIHFKPQGIAEEIDESGEEKDLSGGYDASSTSRDFWVIGGDGLSGNNGVIAAYEAPGGRIMDAVLYSNRTSASDEKYSGFGSSRMLDKSIQLLEEGGWCGSGDLLKPEDAVNPEDSTATRSICRNSSPVDTNSNSDWHIVPTSSSTFGEMNTDDVFVP